MGHLNLTNKRPSFIVRFLILIVVLLKVFTRGRPMCKEGKAFHQGHYQNKGSHKAIVEFKPNLGNAFNQRPKFNNALSRSKNLCPALPSIKIHHKNSLTILGEFFKDVTIKSQSLLCYQWKFYVFKCILSKYPTKFLMD